MTTIVGLTHADLDIAILAADRQSTRYSPNSPTPQKYFGLRKLWIAEDGMTAFGHSGMYSQRTEDLVHAMVAGDIDLQRVIERKKFPELRKLNHANMGDRMPVLDDLSSFLMIHRYNGRPELYTCWPLGSVEERGLTYIGSGSQKVEDYFQSRLVLSEARSYQADEDISNEDAIQAALEAVRLAQERDIYSSGFDMIVMDPRQTHDDFEDLQDDFGSRIAKIQRMHKTPKRKTSKK